MRHAPLTALLISVALPVWAETIPATSRITSITVYPQGAKITREVVFDAPAGAHDLLITDLPAETDPQFLRLSGTEGLTLGATSLRRDRLPPRGDALTPEQTAAKTAVEQLELAERDADANVATVNARIEAAESQVFFLRSMGGQMPDTATPENLQSIARMIGTEVLAAREQALAARKDLWPAEKALEDTQKDLAKARAAYDAAMTGDPDYAALQVAITATAGPSSVTITHFTQNAGWRPVYDISLTRKDTPALTLDRGVLVSQSTGEDWGRVDLTLSTAQPGSQTAPSTLWPYLRRIWPKVDPKAAPSARLAESGADEMGAMAEPIMAAPTVAADALMQGDFVVYHYPGTVDLANGVEDMRLALDQITLAPIVRALAVPSRDRTAFVMADFTNTSAEILLPGTAFLYREGAFIGTTVLASIAPGAKDKLAFGAIESLRLARDMPVRSEGDRGLISKSSQIEDVAILKIENLGDEAWPVRLLDQVPFSEQENLQITYTANPAATETDVDGQRGVLAWEFDLGPGETHEINLTHTIRWPEGMVLE